MRLHRAIGLLALAWAALSQAGCTTPSDNAEHWQIVERFVVDEPAESFDRQALYDEIKVFDWRFEGQQDLDAWRWHLGADDPPARLVPGGVQVRRGARVPSMVRKIDLDAMAIDVIDIEVAGLREGPLRWFWTAPGKNFVAELGSWIEGSAEAGVAAIRHRIAVAEQKGWTGMIHRLRIDPTMAPDEAVRIERVRGIRYQAPTGFLDAAVQLGWKVDIGNDLRNALLAPPGMPVERRVEIPRRGRLRCSYGLAGRSEVAATYRIVAVPEQGERVVLFEDVIEPTIAARSRWRDVEVDLSPFAGQTVGLVLEASSAEPWNSSAGVPVWGNPEISSPSTGERQPNVVVISVDTLRPDHLSLYGYERRTSPRIDAWAEEAAVVFETAVASAPWTLPSHVSLLSGLDADRHGVNHRRPMPSAIRSLPEILRESAYRTLAITGGGWMRPVYGFAQGIDQFLYWPPKTPKDEEIELHVDAALELVEKYREEAFFLFLHTFEVHSPHRRREPYYSELTGGAGAPEEAEVVVTEKSSAPATSGYVVRKTFHWHRPAEGKVPVDREDIPEVIARYDSGIAYADAHLGRLLERLAELDLEQDTLVILTSDHGEAFDENGLDSHGYLYDFNLLVPLVLRLPGGQQGGRRVAEQVRLIDVMPTVLDFLGLSSAAPVVDGSSLRPLIEGQPESDVREAWSYAASSNRGIALRQQRTKYLFNNTAWIPAAGRDALFDLRADPEEAVDISAAHDGLPTIRRRVVERLDEQLSGVEIAVRCGAETACQGRLKGAGIHGFRLKTLEPDGVPLVWDENVEDEARFSVPAGQRGRYLLESLAPEPMTIEVWLQQSPAAAFRAEVDADLASPWELRYQDSGWAVHRQSDAAATVAVTFRRRGTAHESLSVDPSAVDPALREQLRALGYL